MGTVPQSMRQFDASRVPCIRCPSKQQHEAVNILHHEEHASSYLPPTRCSHAHRNMDSSSEPKYATIRVAAVTCATQVFAEKMSSSPDCTILFHGAKASKLWKRTGTALFSVTTLSKHSSCHTWSRKVESMGRDSNLSTMKFEHH